MEDIHWADYTATRVIKDKGNKKEYVCASGITPSGHVHIGNFREIITTDLVVKALERKGKKVKFIYSWDDFDRFRKVPENVPKEFNKYLGMPLIKVPDPFKCHKSYAEHYETELEDSIKKLGFDINYIKQGEMHLKCKYAQGIKIALQEKKEIITILNKYRREPLESSWWPVTIYCEKCWKDTTKVLNYDKKYQIGYECDCGFSNEFDFRKKGNIKLRWRPDWSYRWLYEKVDFEPGGKDHSTPGGSYDTCSKIIKKLWNRNAPTYQIYEWIYIKGGGAFSSSTGNVILPKEVLEIYEAPIIRYLFSGTKPNKEFYISFDLDVVKIYEDFDHLERVYFNKEKVKSEKEKKKLKRIYELSMVKTPSKMPEQPSFRHMTVLTQLYEGDIGKASKGFKSTRVKTRAINAWNWIQKYAPEDMKFKVHDKISDEIKKTLTKEQKNALKILVKKLEKKKYTENSLFNEFYSIIKETDINNKLFFKGAYLALIGKEKGPKLANFILTLGQKRVLNLLRQI
ncbi:MAG: lysine--tRNA ligase [Candidatus Woesearchaeota archaeon]